MNSIIPIPRVPVGVRVATLADLPFLDAMQKKHSRALGYFPTKQFEGYIEMGAVLVAEEEEVDSCKLLVASKEAVGAQLATSNQQLATRRLGYIISRDRYLKRDELGVIYQLCVEPGNQRKLIGAELVKEVFARSAYGCRLYCCWCAQDLEANRFWESMGFVPVAFRAGSSGKKRVHIFWQKRIYDGDTETKWWYPFQTSSGAIREDRLVFPIPPGVHWSEVQCPRRENVKLEDRRSKEARNPKQGPNPKSKMKHPIGPPPGKVGIIVGGRIRYIDRPGYAPPAPATTTALAPVEKPKRAARAAREKVKMDPKLLAAARELRDRYLERINTPAHEPVIEAKYRVVRAIGSNVAAAPLVAPGPIPIARQLPHAA